MAINMETAINNMYALKNRGITYSMYGSRTGSDGTGDCSGTVYDSIRKAGASDAGWVLNTDSLHNWLLQNTFECIATNKEWTAKRGDVVIFGPKGASGGSAGHVVIFISNTQVIHCTYKSSTENGVYVDNEAAGCPYSMGWYVYRLKVSSSGSEIPNVKKGGDVMLLFKDGNGTVFFLVGNQFVPVANPADLYQIKTMMTKAGYDTHEHTNATQVAYIKRVATQSK